MREHHALGFAGSAGRVDERGYGPRALRTRVIDLRRVSREEVAELGVGYTARIVVSARRARVRTRKPRHTRAKAPIAALPHCPEDTHA